MEAAGLSQAFLVVVTEEIAAEQKTTTVLANPKLSSSLQEKMLQHTLATQPHAESGAAQPAELLGARLEHAQQLGAPRDDIQLHLVLHSGPPGHFSIQPCKQLDQFTLAYGVLRRHRLKLLLMEIPSASAL